MPRNMSCQITVNQVIAKIKTVTRRLGWEHAQVGDLIQLVEKGMGLRKGEKVRKLALVRLVSVRREKLGRLAVKPYGTIETTLEGYPPGTDKHDPIRFIEMFCEANRAKGCTPATIVTRLEWIYCDGNTDENAVDAADLRPRANGRSDRKGGRSPQSGRRRHTRLRREKLAMLAHPLNYEITAAGRAHLEALAAAKSTPLLTEPEP